MHKEAKIYVTNLSMCLYICIYVYISEQGAKRQKAMKSTELNRIE